MLSLYSSHVVMLFYYGVSQLPEIPVLLFQVSLTTITAALYGDRKKYSSLPTFKYIYYFVYFYLWIHHPHKISYTIQKSCSELISQNSLSTCIMAEMCQWKIHKAWKGEVVTPEAAAGRYVDRHKVWGNLQEN